MSGGQGHRPDIFILRHGETVWNTLGRFQGRSDSPLTGLGRKQALRQREILRARDDLPDAVDSLKNGLIRRRAGLLVTYNPQDESISYASIAAETGPPQLQRARGIIEPEMVRLAIITMSPRAIKTRGTSLTVSGSITATWSRNSAGSRQRAMCVFPAIQPSSPKQRRPGFVSCGGKMQIRGSPATSSGPDHAAAPEDRSAAARYHGLASADPARAGFRGLRRDHRVTERQAG